MINLEGNIEQRHYWPLWRLVMIGLNALALILSIILSWHYLKGGSMIGCGGGSPCEQVLNSKWSTIAGVLPVSGLAIGVYLTLMIASFFIGVDTDDQIRKLAWNVLLVLAGSIAGSAIWFIIVQKKFVGEFCPYCMTEHIAGLLLAALIIWQARKQIQKKSGDDLSKNQTKVQNISMVTTTRVSRLRVAGLILIGLLMSGILAASQMIFTPKAIYQTGKSQNNLINIDYNTAPIIGSPDAPYVVKLLFDYQCPHCQKIHFMLSEAVRRYGGKLAFVLCPAPLNTQCNPYISRDVDPFKNSCELVRIGLKIWSANREAYTSFENWMFTFESGDKWKPRTIEAVRAKAIELIGETKFNDTLNNDWIKNYMQSCVQIFGQTMQDGKGGIPRLVYGSQWVIPEPNNEDDLIMILQKSLNVPKS
jgi:uncharacterized membrane protein